MTFSHGNPMNKTKPWINTSTKNSDTFIENANVSLTLIPPSGGFLISKQW